MWDICCNVLWAGAWDGEQPAWLLGGMEGAAALGTGT